MIDREFVYEHARQYAVLAVGNDEAKEYAEHYCQMVECLNETMDHWPSHKKAFQEWRRGEDSQEDTCCECNELAVGYADGSPYCAAHYLSRPSLFDANNALVDLILREHENGVKQ